MELRQKICPECGAPMKADEKTGEWKCPVCAEKPEAQLPLPAETNAVGEETEAVSESRPDREKTERYDYEPKERRLFPREEEQPERRNIYVLRWVTLLLANLTAILSLNYMVFYILDHFNPNLHYVVRTDFILTRYLHYLIPFMILLAALLYLLLLIAEGFKQYRFNLKHFLMLLGGDLLVGGLIALSISAYALDWFHLRNENLNVALPTKTISGILGDKYKEKFSDGEPYETTPNTSEVLEDGTVKTLIYTYAGRKSAVEIYHYQKEQLEYQIAEVYVRDISMLNASYATESGDDALMQDFVKDAEYRCIVAINSDNFVMNSIANGLIIRNSTLIRDKEVLYSDFCVIYQDGEVVCYDYKLDKIDNEEILNRYPYHTFHFGPSLLDADGNPREKFNTPLSGKDPRSAFGYYEKGHYAFISVLGDGAMRDLEGNSLGDGKSPGMTLAELAELCSSLGMKAAYNFNGGASVCMYWNETVFGHNARKTSDILGIIDE